MKQWYCIIGGQQYGPVSEDELRNWAEVGRIKLTDQVWSEGMPAWTSASVVPGIFRAEGSPPPMLKPHRGAMVLTLGILGLAVCVICGIIAFVMAKNDLAEMAAGKMDPVGQGMTNAGKICGIISICLLAVGALVGILYFCVIFIVVIAAGLS